MVRHNCGTRTQYGSFAAIVAALLLTQPPSALGQAVQYSSTVDSIFSQHFSNNTPGCAVGVVQNGQFLLRRGYGMANLEYGIANSPTSVFRIGSVSKQFTAAAVVLLALDGKLSLDDDIRDYVPDIPSYGQTITVRHLLHHTSGVRDYLGLMYLAGKREDDFYTDQDVVTMLARQEELNFSPGKEHLYSNAGYFLLSMIVRNASGMSLKQFANERIFEPLGMSSTHFHDNHTHIVPLRASGYSPTETGGYRINMTTLGMVGDGGVLTSVEDLLQWELFFHSEPSANLPTDRVDSFWRMMLTNGSLTNGDTLSYALGLGHGEYRGLRVVSHSGGFVGYRAQIMRFPEQRMSIICLCNVSTANPTRFARGIADVYLADLLEPVAAADPTSSGAQPSAGEPEPASLSHAQKQEFVGSFYSRELDATYQINLHDGDLHLEIGNDLDGRLRLAALDEMRRGGVTLRFSREATGFVTGFSLDAGRVRNLRFVRQ